MKLIANIDGGSRGNPGPAGAGISVRQESGRPILEAGYFLGRMTNNMAEYTALLRALEICKSCGATSLHVYCDSELLVKQINGEYRVKNETLKDFFDQAMIALRAIGDWRIQHVRREGNERADELANLAMDAGEDVIEVDRRGDPVQDYSV
ncbi:MAG TPA: ribonuclease HI family protein [Phycisphaerae bacterium]|nr:ribonuclease HI family protein [Phycisphaerae bacterium]